MANTVSCRTVEPLLSICCQQLSGTVQGDQCVLSLANSPEIGGRFQGCAQGESSTCSDGSVHDGVSGGLGVTTPVTGTTNATSAVGGEDPSASSATGTESASASASSESGSASDGSSSDSASPTGTAFSQSSDAGTTSGSDTAAAVPADGSTSKGPQTLKSSAATGPSPSKTAGATSSSDKASASRSGASAGSALPSPSSSARVERRLSVLALLGAVALAMLAQ
ncbi:hypothetical protein A1Q1_06385 [Trichosporon asahii var. asahii CBS 2479]|uniref:Uncharacterized protein n=1 Tax=Trichosporon asahii var. asahii (strain ATCC 90039 / CBS 2479 / JCM 2466 / KCTC 7840 / NBRC 103889/ NCYC 2677 / UAMH 7654) TaxID=1186058 RepID=J6ERA4_TRIAS|nr:hypothetical protein A1Q1_06385 [Trichosporon asahii var. asahii CBS 2479]EJT45247.1 hypothetical protein A1Q1_06385 [Trichosporon asahii var. asahii CBS 2479]